MQEATQDITYLFLEEDTCNARVRNNELNKVVHQTVSIPEATHEVDNDDEAGGDGAVNGQV